MVWARKPPEEKPDFKEVKARPWEKFADHFREHPEKAVMTSFGGNAYAIMEFGARLLEFKNCGEMIVINEIGLGIEERSKILRKNADLFYSRAMRGIALIETRVKNENVSFESFEMLNAIRKAGIKPEEFVLYAMDVRNDVLLAVKSTKKLRIGAHEDNDYFREFFPDFQKKEGGYTYITIPKEYREKIVCPKPLNIEDRHAPVKADITFSLIYGGSISSEEAYLSNLIKSTKEGGYIICSSDLNDKVADKFDLERVPTNSPFVRVYRVR